MHLFYGFCGDFRFFVEVGIGHCGHVVRPAPLRSEQFVVRLHLNVHKLF